MNKTDISNARSIAISCAARYDKKLKDKQFLIIYKDTNKNILDYIEIVFLSYNYQHLTGLNLIDKNGNLLKNASKFFYKKCIDKKLGNKEIAFKDDGTTKLKLEALSALTDFTSISKITGDSNNRQPFLHIEKVVGGVNFCLGLRKNKDINKYVPVSALSKDIKTITDEPFQVLAILEKDYNDNACYKTFRYNAKGVNLLKVKLTEELKEMISFENYKPPKKKEM